MMDELLRRHLTPSDDGRGFTEAVVFRAAGALARRRQAVADGPTWSVLEFWARPWLIAALLLLAFAVAIPSRPWSAPAAASSEYGPTGILLSGSTDTEVVLSVALGN
jgi:hypothetical protein